MAHTYSRSEMQPEYPKSVEIVDFYMPHTMYAVNKFLRDAIDDHN